jgi:hypothetical protein
MPIQRDLSIKIVKEGVSKKQTETKKNKRELINVEEE